MKPFLGFLFLLVVVAMAAFGRLLLPHRQPQQPSTTSGSSNRLGSTLLRRLICQPGKRFCRMTG